jgi:hypothetical protein
MQKERHQVNQGQFAQWDKFSYVCLWPRKQNEEYLVHVIAIKHFLEQKGTVEDVGKAFGVIVEVRKQLEPLLKAPEGKNKG